MHTVHRQMLSRAFTPTRDQERRGPGPGLRPSSCSTTRSVGWLRLRRRLRRSGPRHGDRGDARHTRLRRSKSSAISPTRSSTSTKATGLRPVAAFNDMRRRSRASSSWSEALARRKNPTDDIMSALVTMEFTDEHGVTRQLDDMEAVQYIHLLSSARATRRRLASRDGPGQRSLSTPTSAPSWWTDPSSSRTRSRRSSATNRRRWRSPASRRKDVTWYDQVVPAGSAVVLLTAATGRDQRQFRRSRHARRRAPDRAPPLLRLRRPRVHGRVARPPGGAHHARGDAAALPRVGRRLGRHRDRAHRQLRAWLLEAPDRDRVMVGDLDLERRPS